MEGEVGVGVEGENECREGRGVEEGGYESSEG